MKHVLLLFAAFTIAFSSFAQTNNNYTLHKVAENETIYRLSVKYKLPVSSILAANPEIQNNIIKVGQIVRIPGATQGSVTATVPPPPAQEQLVNNPNPNTVSTPNYPVQGRQLQQLLPIIHKVTEKETLYSISRKYKQNIEAIRNWNGISNNNIRLGQPLVVAWTNSKGQTVEVPATITPPSIVTTTPPATTTPAAPPVVNKPAAPAPPPVAAKPPTSTPKTKKSSSGIDYTTANPYTGKRRTTARKSLFQRNFERKDNQGYKRIVKTGMSVVFDNSSAGGNGMFIFHKTAPLQSIVKVTNPVNGKIAYLKVLARVPNTGVNDKVIAHIPKSVAKQLNLLDSRPRISTVYHKPK